MSAGDDIERVKGISERVEAATPGPWFVVGPPWNHGAPHIAAGAEDPHVGSFVCDFLSLSDEPVEPPNSEADAAFVAHAREDVPFLLAALDRLQGRLASQTETLEGIAGIRAAEVPGSGGFFPTAESLLSWCVTQARAALESRP